MTTGPATKKSISRNWAFISQRVRVGKDPEIELLSQVLPRPILGPNVPHSHIVQSHVDCSP